MRRRTAVGAWTFTPEDADVADEAAVEPDKVSIR